MKIDDFGFENPSLNVNVERAFSEAEMEFDEKTIPLMGSGKAVKGQGKAVKGQSKKTPVKGSGLLMSEKPVIGSGLLMSEKPVAGNLVKSGKTYAQAVIGGGSVDADGFELVKSKNKRVGSLGIRMPEGLKSVEDVPEWEEIEGC